MEYVTLFALHILRLPGEEMFANLNLSNRRALDGLTDEGSSGMPLAIQLLFPSLSVAFITETFSSVLNIGSLVPSCCILPRQKP